MKNMPTAESFLTPEEENTVVEAIRLAEKRTSGEIRVHLENFEGDDVASRTREVFRLLKMDNTELHNGVIVYVAANQKRFYIYGDEGIHTKVGDAFWQDTKDLILAAFKQGDFVGGLSKGILHIGEVLQVNFPWDSADSNELPDEISKG